MFCSSLEGRLRYTTQRIRPVLAVDNTDTIRCHRATGYLPSLLFRKRLLQHRIRFVWCVRVSCFSCTDRASHCSLHQSCFVHGSGSFAKYTHHHFWKGGLHTRRYIVDPSISPPCAFIITHLDHRLLGADTTVPTQSLRIKREMETTAGRI